MRLEEDSKPPSLQIRTQLSQYLECETMSSGQVSHTQITESQKSELINGYCFKPLDLWVICYTAIEK